MGKWFKEIAIELILSTCPSARGGMARQAEEEKVTDPACISACQQDLMATM